MKDVELIFKVISVIGLVIGLCYPVVLLWSML